MEGAVAVVGTGPAAIACTRVLSAAGVPVTLCTARGKFATQMGPRNQSDPLPGKPFWDYAVQYFTAADPWFAAEVERWRSLGLVQQLGSGEVGTLRAPGAFTALEEPAFVGCGGMGVLMKRLIEDAATLAQVKVVAGWPDKGQMVTGLYREADHWLLSTASGRSLGPFRVVVGAIGIQHCLTDPFLLSGGEACARMLMCLRRVEANQFTPVQLELAKPIDAPFTCAHVLGEENLSFVGNSSRKPQQDGTLGTPGPQTWTLIPTSGFAEKIFYGDPYGYKRAAEKELVASFARAVGVSVADRGPRVNRVLHWEDAVAQTGPPTKCGCLFDADSALAWAADFCVAPCVEGAALSGKAAAETVLRFLSGEPLDDAEALLPHNVPWPARPSQVDIGHFGHAALPPRNTHTDLVPSAMDGWDRVANSMKGSKGAGKSPMGFVRPSRDASRAFEAGKTGGKGSESRKGGDAGKGDTSGKTDCDFKSDSVSEVKQKRRWRGA
jgi:predicted NAD/FAD-dependent oxidoreductase